MTKVELLAAGVVEKNVMGSHNFMITEPWIRQVFKKQQVLNYLLKNS